MRFLVPRIVGFQLNWEEEMASQTLNEKIWEMPPEVWCSLRKFFLRQPRCSDQGEMIRTCFQDSP